MLTAEYLIAVLDIDGDSFNPTIRNVVYPILESKMRQHTKPPVESELIPYSIAYLADRTGEICQICCSIYVLSEEAHRNSDQCRRASNGEITGYTVADLTAKCNICLIDHPVATIEDHIKEDHTVL